MNYLPEKKLIEIARENNIALVYAFGSQMQTGLDLLKNKKRIYSDPLTDIDIGVVFKNRLPGPQKIYELYSSVYNQLEDLFRPYPLDLVFLQETHSVFQANAICGHCLYCCSLKYKEDYEESILRRAADFRPFLERYLDDYLGEA